MAMKAGVRVVRGPDWSRKNQDNGEGFLGTLVYVPKAGSGDHCVTVVWDSGRELRYSAGKNGIYDLRAFDTAPSGVVHSNITCDGCTETPVKGMRWKCASCHDFDLCTSCYMMNKHDTGHGFVRIVAEDTSAVGVPPRNMSNSVQSMGIFPKSKVVRGPHWKWRNQDGGSGEVGKVKEISSWKGVSHNGAREVYWPIPKTTGSFRLGAEGCVDLIFTEPTSGYKYYPDHLPVVDVVNPGMVCLVNGDKVRVALSMKQLHQLQDNPIYGGWADDGGMQQCIDELGTVIDLLFNGKTARVQYEDAKIWTLNRSALTRIHSFKEKEAVKILSNYNTVKELQEGHGGWNDEMQEALGEAGRIVSIESDGDFRVKVKSRIWILSPVCVMPLENDGLASNLPPPLTAADLNDEENDDDEDSSIQGESSYNALAEALAVFITEMMTPKDDVDLEVKIVQAATQGDLQTVKEIVSSHPNMVNRKLEGKSALQLASYEGNTDIVDYLLQKKADVSLDDDEGDTALHYAAFGKEPEALRLLLQNGAKCDAQNNKKQIALHISIAKGCAKCTKQLLNHGSSVTIKDVDGDTPMHDSISAKDGQPEIVQIVLNAKNANFTLENGKGFPVICWAALKDNREALDIMIGKDKSIVDVKLQNEGFTSLHIAAVNDHIEIASDLIHKGKCDVNAQDKVGRNALHLAVAQGHKRTVELLVSAGCDVNCQDNLGNTPLHIAQMSDDSNPIGKMCGGKKQDDVEIQIMYFLVESKADIMKKNKAGKTPIDLAENKDTKAFLKLIHSKKLASMRRSTQRGFMLPLNWESMDGQGFKKVPLSQTKGMEAVEYKEVSQRFRKTLPQSTILSITRVQQPNLWELYHLKRTQMEKEYGSGCANEQQVFHGTLPDVVDTICMQNFDFRLAGERVGTLFGKGTYFAVEAKYSDGYAQPDKNRTKYMFLAKILAGKIALGDPSYNRPPQLSYKNPKLFDCCVDCTKNPRIYCIFDNTQYYPEYLITYT